MLENFLSICSKSDEVEEACWRGCRTAEINLLFKNTLEPLNSEPLNSGKPLINRQARLN